MKKYRIAMLYRKSNYFWSGHHFDNCTYNFYYGAMRRNPRIEMSFVCDDNEIDLKPLNGKYDALIFYDVSRWGGPDRYLNIDSVTIPKIYMTGDCHDVNYIAEGQTKSRLEMCREFKFDYYYSQFPVEYFHKYYPKEFRAKWVPFGVEPRLYESVKPFRERDFSCILNTGALSGDKHYRLRRMCNSVPCVKYSYNYALGISGDNYVRMLELYGAGIAAMTTATCNKVFEIPAAGCVGFVEVTEENNAGQIGFEDGKTAVFINENNYKDVFDDYMKTSHMKKWDDIASAGRKFVLEKYSNDAITNRIIEILEEI